MLDAKSLYRRLETMLEAAGDTSAPRSFAVRIVPLLVEHFSGPLEVGGAQLYDCRNGRVALLLGAGDKSPDLSDELRSRRDGEFPARGAEWPWLGETAAGPTGLLRLTEDDPYLIALRFRVPLTDAAGPGPFLPALQHTLSQHLRRRELESQVEQALAIQLSLLPDGPPVFGDFDIAAVSVPARVVGGDIYDYIPVDAETLALAVADAAGHGLPAALQARDVATGLRMGIERDFKIPRSIEKLNRVIHRSGLVSRFVSLFFGELELNGNFFYINAGHPPALLLDNLGLRSLEIGGPILGPIQGSVYKQGFTHVDRGAAMVLYSDGVIECGAERGEHFGQDRLAEWLEAWRNGPSDKAVADLLDRLRKFGGSESFADDVTAMLVRRPA